MTTIKPTFTVTLYLEYQVDLFDATRELARIDALNALCPGMALQVNGIRAIDHRGKVMHERFGFGQDEPRTAPPSMPTFPGDAFPETETPAADGEQGAVTPLYLGPDDYRDKTGKRYRMTKDQKDRALSRDEAFDEFITENQHYAVDN